MWNDLLKYSAQFKSAVLTGLDADGYPYSIRCFPAINESRQLIRVAPANGAAIEPGRAGLLFHRHNEQLWDLKIFQVRGRLEQDSQGWLFYPEQLIHGSGLRHPLHAVATIFNMRRAAKMYLAKRGLPRPRIPWQDIKALYP
jgi:hypothetical protein